MSTVATRALAPGAALCLAGLLACLGCGPNDGPRRRAPRRKEVTWRVDDKWGDMRNVRKAASKEATLYTWTGSRFCGQPATETGVGVRVEPNGALPAEWKKARVTATLRNAGDKTAVLRHEATVALEEVRRARPGWEAQVMVPLTREQGGQVTTIKNGAYTIDIEVKLGKKVLSTAGAYYEVHGRGPLRLFDEERLDEEEEFDLGPIRRP